MAITWAADVVPIAPSLSTASTTFQNLILAIVNREIDDEVWGTFADDGRRFLAAHFGTIMTGGAGGAAGGPITSESLGAMTRSYGMIQGEVPPALQKTWYGLEYYRILLIAVAVPALVP